MKYDKVKLWIKITDNIILYNGVPGLPDYFRLVNQMADNMASFIKFEQIGIRRSIVDYDFDVEATIWI
jgi:hypothetical protein